MKVIIASMELKFSPNDPTADAEFIKRFTPTIRDKWSLLVYNEGVELADEMNKLIRRDCLDFIKSDLKLEGFTADSATAFPAGAGAWYESGGLHSGTKPVQGVSATGQKTWVFRYGNNQPASIDAAAWHIILEAPLKLVR